MDWDIKKLVNDPDWQALPYEERFKAIKEVDPDFAALPAAERAKGIQEMRGVDLKAAHAANVAAGEAAYKPSWIEAYQTGAATGGGPGGLVSVAQQMGKDVGAAIEETPQRLGGMITSVPEIAKRVVLPPALGGGVPPLLKQAIESTTEPLISPRTTGKALTEAGIDTALTAGTGKALSYGAKTVAPAAARRITQSWLKPAEGDFKFSKDPVNAFLEEKFTGSLPKVRADVVARKGQYLKDVQEQLAQSTEATPRSQVLDILEGEKGRIASEVGVTNDKALNRGIDIIKRKIEANYPEELSQTDLHKLRKEIDASIPKFSSEAVEQGLNNVRYNLRTGINEIMEAKSPGIAKANARVSELIDIDRMLGNRVRQAGNAPLPGFGKGTTLADLALMLPRAALGSPAVMTRAANVLNTFAPKPGIAGAIGSVGAAPMVAPRQPGLAGALARTKPAPAFKGDIKSAAPPPVPQAVPSLSQAATQLSPPGPAGPAATVPSPQPAGGLGAAIAEPPMVPPPANLPPGMQRVPGLAAIIDEIVKRQQMPRSVLESTPTLMAPEESLTLSKVRPITGGSGLSGALEAQGATAPINLLSKEPVTAKIPPKSPSLAEFDIRVLDGLDAEGGYNYTALNDFPKGNPNVPDLKAKIGPQLQKLQEQGIAGKSIKDLKALPIEDTAKVSELKESFAKHGDKPEGFAAKRVGLPTLEIRPGGKMILTNGRHRLEAARQAGLKELKFHVQKFDPDGDMLWDAITPVRISEGPLRRQRIWYTKEK